MGLCFCGLSVKFSEVQHRRPWTTLASLSCLISTHSHTLLPFSQNQRETFIMFSQHLILYFNEELFSSSPLRLRQNSVSLGEFCFWEEFWGGVVMAWMRLQFWETMSWEVKGELRMLRMGSQLDFISVVPPQHDVKIAHMKRWNMVFHKQESFLEVGFNCCIKTFGKGKTSDNAFTSAMQSVNTTSVVQVSPQASTCL